MILRTLALVFTVLLVVGCSSNLPQTIRVTGRVTFDGHEPPAPGSVFFLPQESAKGFPSRPATGNYDKQGYFKAMTFEPGDGLMPGKYLISVESWQAPPDMSGKPGASYIPKKYQSPQTSGFALDITPTTRPQYITLEVVTK